MRNALDLTPDDWKETMRGLGQPSYRAGQVFSALHRGAAFAQITNIPAALREKLADLYDDHGVTILQKFESALDGTKKYLYRLSDGNLIEGVRMVYHHGHTLCVSTQVGCRMHCAFCASTLEGCVRSLSSGEILGQIVAANRDEPQIHNVVLMGSGEPLDNYDETVRFLRLTREPEGIGLSTRSISLSTCGLTPRIIRLADERMPVTLSVSLHAPNDEVRSRLMPVARAYPMEGLLDACRYYIRQTGRRVIFEYALVGGVNCRREHASELASKLRGMQCHVNLIALNPVPECGLAAASETEIAGFQRQLETDGISVTRRREMGRDIAGACGQLRRGYLNANGAGEVIG